MMESEEQRQADIARARRSYIYEDEIELERRRQDEKWGPQDHQSVDQVLLDRGAGPERLCEYHEIANETRAKYLCKSAAQFKQLTWAQIAIEELSEAISAPDDAARRAELIQLAAVAVAWIECIDRRRVPEVVVDDRQEKQ